MPISLTCGDCEHEFSAWDDLAGRTVQCPKCKASVLVGGEVDESEWEEEDESEEDDFNLAPAEESLIATPLATLPTTDDLTGEAAQPPSDGPPTECPKCGAGLSDGMLCDACGYNVQLKRVIHSDVETFEANPDIGFKRWFNSQLAEVESRELANIEKALNKIREGSFGKCEYCPKTIPLARLKALPYATTCIDCQRLSEEGRLDTSGDADWSRVLDSGSDNEATFSDIEMHVS